MTVKYLNATGIDEPDGSFDVVFSAFVLHFPAERGKVLTEVARVLRPTANADFYRMAIEPEPRQRARSGDNATAAGRERRAKLAAGDPRWPVSGLSSGGALRAGWVRTGSDLRAGSRRGGNTPSTVRG